MVKITKRKSTGKRKLKVVGLRSSPVPRPMYLETTGGKYGSVNTNLLPATPINQFKCAVDDPFCSTSMGARVPDEYSANTQPMTVRARFPVSNNSGSGVILFLPFPTLSAIAWDGTDIARWNVWGAATGGATTSTFNVNTNAGGTSVIKTASCLTSPAFSQFVNSYRVVGWGVRLKCLQPASTVGGDCVVAVGPLTQYLPQQLLPFFDQQPAGAPTLITARPTYTSWYELSDCVGFPVGGFTATNGNGGSGFPLLDQESTAMSETYSNVELAQTGGIVVKPKFHSSHNLNFRSAGTAKTLGTHSYVVAAAQGGASASIDTANFECMNAQGHNAIMFQGAGGMLYEAEVIYHLEVVPNVPVTTAGVLNGLAGSPSPSVPRALFEKTLQQLKESPWVEFVKHEGQRAIGSMTQALPGLMTRMAAMALAAA